MAAARRGKRASSAMGGVASELVGASRERQSRKRKQFHTVELKVRMDCDGCELKVRNTLARLRGTYALICCFNLPES